MMVQDTFAERLFTMKIKSRLVCFVMTAAMAVCAMTACSDSAENTSSSEWTPHKFGISDTTANGVKLNMTVDEVKAAIGEPDKEENITEDQFIYGEHLNMTYGQMHLSFYDINEGNNLKLGSISSNSPEVIFAGGLHVGNTKDEVLGAFTQEEDTTDLMLYGEKYGSFIYGDLISDYFIERKPTGAIESAYIQDHDAKSDGYYMIIYTYYNPLQWSDDGSSYTGDYYHMVFYVDTATDKVNSILLEHMNALA